MAVASYTKSGTKASSAPKLDSFVFGAEIKSHDLVKQVYVAHQANGRENLAKTLKRGEVRGGGKKPWKQKGTGRARFGSIRVPIWRGGGITFGPLGKENYSKKVNIKAKRTAIRQALTMNKDNIIIVESFDAKDGKTATAAKLLSKIGAGRKVLLVVENKTPEIIQATRNIDGVTLVQANYLNVFDIMNADSIVISQKSLDIIHEWLGKSAADKKAAKTADKKETK